MQAMIQIKRTMTKVIAIIAPADMPMKTTQSFIPQSDEGVHSTVGYITDSATVMNCKVKSVIDT